MPRQRKPTRLKVLEGNPGRRPLPANEPQPQGDVVMPEWLSAGGRLLWAAHAPEMQRLGLLTTLDVETFANWCEASSLVNTCTRMLESEGVMLHVHGQRTPHPAVGMRVKAVTMARQLANVLGLTPSSRAGLGTQPAGKVSGFQQWWEAHHK